MLRWRDRLGNKAKGIRTEVGQLISALYLGNEISPSQREEMSKLANRLDRKLTTLEGKLQPPPIEASFEEPDGTKPFGAAERNPGEDDD
jgi:hypothetical protein